MENAHSEKKPDIQSLCAVCRGLSIEELVRLATLNPSLLKAPIPVYSNEYRTLPFDGSYPHYDSLAQLDVAANQGCAFCSLVRTGLQRCLEMGNMLLHGGISRETYDKWGFELGESMWSIANSLDDTRVRVRIHKSEYSRDMSKVPVFDILQVQIGSYEGFDEERPTPCLDPLSLNIKHDPGMRIERQGFRVGRAQINPDVGAEENFNIARRWLAECIHEHSSCSTAQATVLPTRVIDVATGRDPTFCRIVDGAGRQAQYAALSHCWGGEIIVVLSDASLQSFRNHLPWDTLPLNFQDAITITRELGLRYLWIDSLCILQDSKEDWERESRNMASIYLNSTITIAASASANSAEGILSRAVYDWDLPPPVDVPVSSRQDSATGTNTKLSEACVGVEIAPWEENLERLQSINPLAHRGWTFQEYLLSPRMIFYGNRQIYWRCTAGLQAADEAPPGNEYPESYPATMAYLRRYQGIRQLGTKIGESEREAILMEYYLMIREYAQRELTFDSDKLPALSGLATILQGAIGGSYLAGLWASDIVRGLCWAFSAMEQRSRVVPYRAPSWSWAMTNARTYHLSEYRDLPSANKLSAVPVRYSVIPCNPLNPFGAIEHAEIVITALCAPVVRLDQHYRNRGTEANPDLGAIWFDELDDGLETAQETSDWHSIFLIEPCESTELAGFRLVAPLGLLWGESGLGDQWKLDSKLISPVNYLIVMLLAREPSLEKARTPAVGLIVTAARGAKDDETFERAGIVEFAEDVVDYPGVWSRRTIKLI